MLKFIGSLLLLAVLLAARGLYGQPLTIEKTIDGMPQNARGMLATSLDSDERLDFNGDLVPERVFTVQDPAAGDYLRIVDGTDPSRDWIVRLEGDPDRPMIIGVHTLVGFYNIDGIVTKQNPKEMVFAKRVPAQNRYYSYRLEDVLISSYSAVGPSPRQPLGIIAILIGLFETDRDGKTEVMLVNPDTRQTEIWGAP
ncbi:MAG: hypothetical protein RBU27_11040 [Bacteroidota bacterium]|jgi:hypothetical protein|nr:hypothetical protein [Bacteroidota bacterium]